MAAQAADLTGLADSLSAPEVATGSIATTLAQQLGLPELPNLQEECRGIQEPRAADADQPQRFRTPSPPRDRRQRIPERPGRHGSGSCDVQEVLWAPGPHDTCNYVLPGRLLAGSYPGDRSEPEHTAKVRCLISAGVDTFICLQEIEELRSRFTPYVGVARALAAHEGAAANGKELEFWHCPIPDNHITSNEALEACLATIVEKLLEGRQVYVHCWGGHGRTGSVLCALLVRIYGLTTDQAQKFFLATHRNRRNPRGGKWPHSIHQHRQVQRLEGQSRALTDRRLPPLEDWSPQRRGR